MKPTIFTADTITDEQIREAMLIAMSEHDSLMERWCIWALGDIPLIGGNRHHADAAYRAQTSNARLVVARRYLNARAKGTSDDT